jgi:hypothetical protein
VAVQEFFSNKASYVALIFIVVFGIPMVARVVGYFWYKARRDELLACLKRDMLERGLSAEEIRTVIEAGAPPANEVDQTITRVLAGTEVSPK